MPYLHTAASAALGQMVMFYGSQDPVLSVPSVMGPWSKGYFVSNVVEFGSPLLMCYSCHQLWVHGFNCYLVHIAPIPHSGSSKMCICPPHTNKLPGRMVVFIMVARIL